MLHDRQTDRELVAAVARALGEAIGLVRSRGFHGVDIGMDSGGEPSGSCKGDDSTDAVEAVDLAATGLDWDAHDDARLDRYRRIRRRRRRAA